MNNLKYSLHKYNYLYNKNKYFNTIKENILFNYKKIFEYNQNFMYRNYFKYSCLDYYELDKKLIIINSEQNVKNKNEFKKITKVIDKIKDNK